jgi:exosortase
MIESGSSAALEIKSAKVSRNVRKLTLGISLAILILLFIVWPYQHWQFAVRDSVLAGWFKVLSLTGNAEWQFCFIVPLIAGALVYRERHKLEALPLQGEWWGALILAFAMLVYWMGYKVDTGYLGFAAIQLTLAGLIVLMAGRQWMRVLFFAWIFMFFAWPLFPLDNMLAARLKIPTAQIGAKLVSLMGVDVVREGSALQSAADFGAGIKQGEKFTLDVSESCSGMRSLYALIMISVLYGFLALNRTSSRLILAFSAIPLAVAGNVVRLLLLTIGAMLLGQETAVGNFVNGHQEESFFHLLAGYVVFAVALVGMFALATLLDGKHWKKIGKKKPGEQNQPVNHGSEDIPRKNVSKYMVAVLMALAGVGLCWSTPETVNYAKPGLRMELPSVVGDYRSPKVEDMTAKETANFDDSVQLVRRLYTSAEGHQILGTLVMSGVMKRTLHTPERCLPDQGWIIAGLEEMPLTLPDGRSLTVSFMRIFRDVELPSGQRFRLKGLNLYWYHGSQDVSTPSYFGSNYLTYRDAIFRNLNHRWGQVSFFMPLPPREIGKDNPMEEIMAMEELKTFVGRVASEILLPGSDGG